MGGRLADWLGQGLAADRPAAAAMAALLTQAGVAFYFSHDDKILHIYDDDDVAWYSVDVNALATLSFETLPDVDWSTPPTDGQIFTWDTASGKLVPENLLVRTTEEFQDLVGAMFINGTGITAAYNDATGLIEINSTITQYTDEMAMDALAAAFAAGTHVGFTVTYNDGTNSYDFDVDASWVEGLADGRIAAASIAAFTDVDLTGIADGDTLIWVAANSRFEPQAPAGAGSIDTLNDVDTSTSAPVAGDGLVWDGANFVPGIPGLIAQLVVTGAPAPSVTFSSIPQDYENLRMTIQGRGTTAAATIACAMRFNNDSGTNYDGSLANRFGSAPYVGATSHGIGNIPAASIANRVGQIEAKIANYRRATLWKSHLVLNASSDSAVVGGQYGHYGGGNWRSTAAINRLDAFPTAGSFEIGTVISLFAE